MSAPSTRWLDREVKTLLVDLDGTLLASPGWPLRVEIAVRALVRLGRKFGFRRAFRALKAIAPAILTPSESERELLNAERAAIAFGHELDLSAEEASVLLVRGTLAIFRHLKRHFRPVPGAREFILGASKRYRLILATNPVWPLEQVHLRLKWAGLNPALFASITHSGRMHFCKPSVEYYHELLEQEGLDPAECALVGDSLRKDLPATRAGIPVFILSDKKLDEDLEHETLPPGFEDARARATSGSFVLLARLLAEVPT